MVETSSETQKNLIESAKLDRAEITDPELKLMDESFYPGNYIIIGPDLSNNNYMAGSGVPQDI